MNPQGVAPLFRHMTSFEYKMSMVADRVVRIRRIINSEQLIEAAKAQKAQRVSARVKEWTRLVRQYGGL